MSNAKKEDNSIFYDSNEDIPIHLKSGSNSVIQISSTNSGKHKDNEIYISDDEDDLNDEHETTYIVKANEGISKNEKRKRNSLISNQLTENSVLEIASSLSSKDDQARQNYLKKTKEINNGKDFNSLYTRVSPHSLFGAVNSMNENQKKFIKKVGFGPILDMKTQSVPMKLAFFVIDSFDPDQMVIKTPNANIPVTREAVHHVLGLPLGVEQISCLPTRGNEKWYSDWKEQFHKPVGSITPTDVLNQIIGRPQDDIVFLANFIILICTTFGSCNKQGTCNSKFIRYLSEKTMVDNIDWCSYVLSNVKEEKKVWNEYENCAYFNGPTVFLTLLYVDCIICENMRMVRRSPVINNWTFEQLKFRESIEIKNGGFGNGAYHDINCDAINYNSLKTDIDNLLQDVEIKVDFGLSRYPYTKILLFMKKKLLDIKAFVEENQKQKQKHQNMKVDYGSLNQNSVFINQRNSHNSSDSSVKCKSIAFVDLSDIESEKKTATSMGFNMSSNQSTLQSSYKSFAVGLYNKPVQLFSSSHLTQSVNELYKSPSHSSHFTRRVNQVYESPSNKSTSIVNGYPSFSLGIDEDSETQLKQSNICKKSTVSVNKGGTLQSEERNVSNIPIQNVKFGKQITTTIRAKRLQILPPSKRSPFVERVVDIDSSLTKDENSLSNWVFSISGDPSETVFKTETGQIGQRHMFESLCPHEHPFSGVIDCFVEVLNYNERFRNMDTPSCFFFKTYVMTPSYMDFGGYVNQASYNCFKENLEHCLGESEEKRKLKGFDLVFFPACRDKHYFVYVFDFKKRRMLILDNILYLTPEDPFQNVTRNLKNMFGRYLEEKKHHMASSVQYDINPENQYMTWKTSNNWNDCAIFAIRHMETYKGGGLVQWKTGFKMEGAEQLEQLRKLRRRYCMKILMSEVNVMKNDISNHVIRYLTMPDAQRRSMYQNAMMKLSERLSKFE